MIQNFIKSVRMEWLKPIKEPLHTPDKPGIQWDPLSDSAILSRPAYWNHKSEDRVTVNSQKGVTPIGIPQSH